MRWLTAPLLRPYLLLAVSVSLVLNLMLLMPAIFMVQVFDRVFASRSLETLAMLSVLVTVALMLAYVMDVVRARALAAIGSILDERLAPSALSTMLNRASSPHRESGKDSLRDVAALRAFLSGSAVLALFDAPWVPLYLVVITFMHPVLGAAALAGAALLFALAYATERLTRERAEHARKHDQGTRRYVHSLLRNADVIGGMRMVRAAVTAWRTRHDEVLRARDTLGARSNKLAAAARVARQALQAALLGIGAWLVIAEHASPGIMVAATILLGRALAPVEQLIGGWKSFIEARAAWQRIAAPGGANLRSERLVLPAPCGRIEVDAVVYGVHADRPPIIKGVSFALMPGESLGLVGPSAAGKTTLLRVLLGLWTPRTGVVRIDGADIAQWDQDALGAHVGYLPQDVELFPGTVAENIARLNEPDHERVVEAARAAHAHEMILALPHGYDTVIGESGANLSGGQRQRVALARALYGAPKFVVLDEPNSNLDAEGEAALVAALAVLKDLKTTVIIATHRTALLSRLDKVAVLKDGVLEAFGPPTRVSPRLRPVARGAMARGQSTVLSATGA